MSNQQVTLAGPARPPMEPASGLRRIKLRPHEMSDTITASEDVFVLAHLGVPRIDPAQWRLSIDGLVGEARTLGLDDLKARPKSIVEAVHQCCGNPLEPNLPTRRVVNVRWGGVDLAALLDGGAFAGTDCDWYVKDMPLERLAAGGVLIAHEMNDAPLAAEHGFPVRLVVPGYYGTNSVKWVWRLHVASHRAHTPFTTSLYNDAADEHDIAAGLPARRPVWAIAPESIIVAPAPDASIALGERTEIRGWAWSFGGVARAEVSVDGGASFARALLEQRHGWSWQRFSLSWQPATRGEALLSVRAFGASGIGQPPDGARNAIHTVRVLVR